MEKVCSNCFRPCEGNFCPYCGYEQGSALKKYTLALPEGSVLNGRYIVGRVLGQGGFGITYVSQDYNTKSLVAIKEFFPDSLVTRTSKVSVSTISADRRENFNYGKECFLKEAETLSHFIGHPNIVTIYSYFEENNTAYLAMEYLDGESFLDYLRRRGRISWEETRKICEPVMDALAFVHSKGLIHRDISPDNIFMCKDGTVKLIDFGAARYSLGDRSQSLSVVLKHGFAPMEQYTRRGHQGPYTDIYALAATMYRSVTGKVPPEAPDRMYDDELKPPTSLGADMPARDEEALLKALAFNYNDRWQTVGEFRSALSEKNKPYTDNTVADNDGELYKEPEKTLHYDSVVQSTTVKNKISKRKKQIIIEGIVAATLIITVITIWLSIWRPWQPFEYVINGKEVTITGYRFKDSEKVEIPSEIDGYPVTRIEDEAFHNCYKITSVVISYNVKSIGDNAFSSCTSLTSVTIPDSVEYIEDFAFDGCDNLESVTIPDGVTSIGKEAFCNCISLKSVILPDSVKKIGMFAFANCNLDEISLPNGCDAHYNIVDDDVKITYR